MFVCARRGGLSITVILFFISPPQRQRVGQQTAVSGDDGVERKINFATVILNVCFILLALIGIYDDPNRLLCGGN